MGGGTLTPALSPSGALTVLGSWSLDDKAQAAGLKTQLVKWLQLGLVRLDESLEEAGEVDAGAVGLDADEEPLADAFEVDAARDAELVVREADAAPWEAWRRPPHRRQVA